MKRVTKKREIVKSEARIKIQEDLVNDLLAVEDGQILDRVRNDLFDLFKVLLEKLMQLELRAKLGYEAYAKTNATTTNSRNGYRERKKLVLKEGLMENIRIPRDRNGEYRTGILPRAKRYEPELMDCIQQLYLNCNSTRPLSQMATTLFDWPMSHSQVSSFCQELDDEVSQWKKRPLADVYVGMFLDAVWLPLRRYHQKSEKECMLIILGVTIDGCKDVLGVKLVGEESAESWEELLREIKARGVKGENLVIAVTDGVTGLRQALLRIYPKLFIQRCVVHKERNVLHYVSHRCKDGIANELKDIFAASNAADAIKRKEAFCVKWHKTFPSAVNALSTDFEDCITFLKIRNFQLRKLFYTNNPIERINKEIKRRVRVMEMLPAEETAYRIVYWVVQKLTKSWQTYKVRGHACLPNLKQEFTH